MGVKACFRHSCDNIMCDHYSTEHGYICNQCLSELKETCTEWDSVEQFMNTPRSKKFPEGREERLQFIDEEFS